VKKLRIFITLLLLIFAFASCSGEKTSILPDVQTDVDESTDVSDLTPPEENEEIVELPEIDPTKTEISLTTGLPCTPDEKNERPVAVMINNIAVSHPQFSVSDADIIYECDAEGGITRLMGIFSNWKNLDVIGSIRSARDYFVSIAEGHDAIYVHAGGSDGAYEEIIYDDVDNIDGVNMYTIPESTFYRDKDRIKNCGYEHSMMTTGSKLEKAVEVLKYRTQYKSGFESGLNFNKDALLGEGEKAEEIEIQHSSYITVKFTYDKETNKYLKYSYSKPHVDGKNDMQLTFDNVIVIFVSEKVLDSAGRLDVGIIGEGTGYYFANSLCYDITWSKKSDTSPIIYYIDGTPLELLPGKTHVTLFNKKYSYNVTKK